MNYQTGTVLPYWIKTVILRRKGLTPPQLYKFENLEDDNNVQDTAHQYDTKAEA